jgi:hypothetical protein
LGCRREKSRCGQAMVRWEVKTKEDILDWAMKKRKLLGTKKR